MRILRATNGTILRAAFLAVSLACFFASQEAPCAQRPVETVLFQKFGNSADDIYGTQSAPNEASSYFSRTIQAFCISNSSESQFLYLLDHANGRIKKFSLNGNPGPVISFDSKKTPGPLTGIAVSEGKDGFKCAIHSKNTIYWIDESGKITARQKMPEGFECHKIFFCDGFLYAYDFNDSRFLKSVPDKLEADYKLYENISCPWPFGKNAFFSCLAPSRSKFMILKNEEVENGLNVSCFFEFKAAGESKYSNLRILGFDGKGSLYLRYFSGNYETFLAISQNGKIADDFTIDIRQMPERSCILYDECVDGAGTVYIVFVEADKLIVKKIKAAD